VEVVLGTEGAETIVSLLHHGFSRKADFEHYSSQLSGWNWALHNLKAFLERKPIVQYEEWLKKK